MEMGDKMRENVVETKNCFSKLSFYSHKIPETCRWLIEKVIVLSKTLGRVWTNKMNGIFHGGVIFHLFSFSLLGWRWSVSPQDVTAERHCAKEGGEQGDLLSGEPGDWSLTTEHHPHHHPHHHLPYPPRHCTDHLCQASQRGRSGPVCFVIWWVGLLCQERGECSTYVETSRIIVWLFSWCYDCVDPWLWLCDKPPYFRHTGPPEQVLRGGQTEQWRGAPGLWDSSHHQGKGGRGPSFILPSCNEHWGCEMMLVLWCVITTTFLLR